MSDFRKDKTGSAQTAANAAATLVAAFAEQFNFDDAVKAYNELREGIFEDLAKVVDADNELFASVGASNGKSSGSTAKSEPRGRKTGGGRSSGGSRGSGKSSISLDDALSLELSWGAFEGETLETVLGLTAEQCDEQYAYGDGERDGRDYISWLASDKNQNEFVRNRARIIAREEGIEFD